MLKNILKPFIFILNAVSYLIFCLTLLIVLIWITIFIVYDSVRKKHIISFTESVSTILKMIKLGFYNTFAYGKINTFIQLGLNESFTTYVDVFNYPYRTYYFLNRKDFAYQKLITNNPEDFKTQWERNTLKRLFITG